ncbi:recombination protein NinG, partial [Pseudomonas veronii]|uniref:recombination protein NinG n=1 Tax=Pseudomonas veronii TaxID=76761 RepID=UPI000F816D9A
MITTKQPRSKTCKNPACSEKFIAQRLGQAVCSPKCGLAIKDVNQTKARKALAEVGRREIEVRKEALKTRSDHAKEAQAVINRYVRLRDAHLGCISCDKPATWRGQWHCSHFRSVGAAPHIRYNLWNMNRACSVCNNH